MERRMKKSTAGFILFCLVFLYPQLPVSGQAGKTLENRLPSLSGAERIDALLQLMEAYSAEDPKKELAYGEEALQLLEKASNPQRQVDLLNRLSSVCNYLGDYGASAGYVNQALEISQRIDYKVGYANALYAVGRMNYYQGIYDRAKTSLAQAGALYKDLDDQVGRAQALNTLGLVHWRLSDYPRALEYVLESCKIRENLQGKTNDLDTEIAFSYNNIGLIYLDMKDYEKAKEYFFEAKRIHEAHDNKGGKAIILNNIAVIYRDQGNYRKALDYYDLSLKLNQELGYKHGTAITLSNLGSVYEKLKNYTKAMAYLNLSLSISKETNQQKVMSNVLISMGRIRRELGHYQKALQRVNQGLDLALKIKVKEEIRSAHQELSEIYAALKDYAKSLHYLKKTKEITDAIFSETSSMKIAELQTRFEMEKKEKDIALLKKDKDIQDAVLAKQKNINYLILAASLLAFIVLLVFFIRYRLRHKMTRALGREVKEHQQTTKKLQESEETFRVLAEASKVGIYILQDNVIKYVNPKFLSIFGWRDAEIAEILEQDFLKLVVAADRPLVLEKMKQRLSGASAAVRCEFKGMTRAGEILHLESWGGLIHYQGQPAVLETLIDITPRKKTEEKLLKSQKLQALGILAGGIAHDYNNLLAILVGYLDMIKDDLPAGSRGTLADILVENIEDAYTQATELGEKLVVFSKGGWIMPQKVTLISLLKGALDLEADRKIGTYINLSIPHDLNPIRGDERQLKQAVAYLLDNTRETITGKDKEEYPVTLRAENIFIPEGNDFFLAQGEYVRIFLNKNRCCIPADQLPTIFEPFFSSRTDSPQSSQQGTGLELAICHSIIKKHNGHIDVTSEPGEGTTFQLLLPVYRAD
jgi:PAS domain S-box-containing protein